MPDHAPPHSHPIAANARTGSESGRIIPLAPSERSAKLAASGGCTWPDDDHGVDVIGLGRAFAYDVTHLTLQQGASTITEQLAKVLYLGGDDHSPWRKLEDAAVAVRLEGVLTREQILAASLNSVYFGDGATGIGRAAMRYFRVPASRLTLSEASLLAGLIQAPTSDDPCRFPQLARLRRADVLRSTWTEQEPNCPSPFGCARDHTRIVAPGTEPDPHGA